MLYVILSLMIRTTLQNVDQTEGLVDSWYVAETDNEKLQQFKGMCHFQKVRWSYKSSRMCLNNMMVYFVKLENWK